MLKVACWRKRVGCRGYFELMSVFMGLILAIAVMPLIAHMFSRRLRLHGGARLKLGTMMLLQAACRGVALKGLDKADKIRMSWTPALAHQPLTCAIVSTAPCAATSDGHFFDLYVQLSHQSLARRLTIQLTNPSSHSNSLLYNGPRRLLRVRLLGCRSRRAAACCKGRCAKETCVPKSCRPVESRQNRPQPPSSFLL